MNQRTVGDMDSQDIRFSRAVTLNQRAHATMNLQIIAVLIVGFTLYTSYQSIATTRDALARQRAITEAEAIEDLARAWNYDRLLLEQALEPFLEQEELVNATRVLLLVTLLLAEQKAQLDMPPDELEARLDEFGQLSQDINRYRQALLTLRFSTSKYLSDFDAYELETYREYLSLERRMAFSKEFGALWTRVCKLAAVMRHLGDATTEERTTVLAQAARSEQAREALLWAERQLVRTDEGSFVSSLEFAGEDPAAIVLLVTEDLLGEATSIATLRTSSYDFTHPFEEQEGNEAQAREVLQLLDRSGHRTLAEVDAHAASLEQRIRRLGETQEIPIPFLGIEVSVAIVGWFLPIVNLGLLVMIIRTALEARRHEDALDDDSRALLREVADTRLGVHGRPLDYWCWTAHRNAIGCFGLSICAAWVVLAREGTVAPWLLPLLILLLYAAAVGVTSAIGSRIAR